MTFHRVLPEELRRSYPYPGLAVTPEELRWFLSFFTCHFRCGSLREAWTWWTEGQPRTVPTLAITFDDGQLDNYVYARPVLAEPGLHATFYVPVLNVDQRRLIWHDRLGFSLLAARHWATDEQVRSHLAEHGVQVDAQDDLATGAVEHAKRLAPPQRERLVTSVEQLAGGETVPDWTQVMNWEQLRDLARDGHEIGSHGMSHALLPQSSDEELHSEIVHSRAILEEQLELTVDSFCYPDGACDDRVAEAVSQAGYRNAVTTTWGRNHRDTSPLRLRRCDMDARRSRNQGGHLSNAITALRLSGLHPALRETP